VDIDDLVAVVGDKAFAVNRITSQLHNGPRHVTSRHWYHFHRQWKVTEGGNVFAFVCDTDKFPGYCRNDLFAGQRSAAPLDQVQLRIGLVRPIDIDRHLAHHVQVFHQDAQSLQATAGFLRTGNGAADAVPKGGQAFDEQVGGGSGAHSQHTPGDQVLFHIVRCCLCDSLFHFVLIHANFPGGIF